MGSRFRIGRTLVIYNGQGAGEPGPFNIREPGIWGLSWSYRCPKGRLGDFVLGEPHSWIGLGVTEKSHGNSAHGLYWVTGDAGPHSLVVASDCGWQLKVVLPAAGS